jgi:DNA-binding GntR family transcriptional regulator
MGKRPASDPKAGKSQPHDKILQALRERIARHELPPGGKLLEKNLSAEFGVSRARIRDVLAVLQQRGLVRRIPNRGAVVESLDLEKITDLYAVREVVEGLAARLAAERIPPESWQDLIVLFGKPMEDDIRRGDFDAYVKKLELLRERMLAGAGNPVLADIIGNIQDRARMIMRRVVILPGRAETGLKEHRAMLQALRRGDGAAAEACMRANIRSGLAFLHRFQSFLL